MPRPFGGSSKTWNVEHDGLSAFGAERNTSGWKKFRLLLWKNWTIQKRHKWQIFLEIFLPVFCSIILIIVRHFVPADFVSFPTDFGDFYVDTAPVDTVQARCNEIYYTPKNPATDRLMQEIADKYFKFGLQGIFEKNYKVTGFDTEEELVESYTRIEKYIEEKEKAGNGSKSIIDKLGLFGDTGANVPILAGVIFTNEFEDDGNTFSNNIAYTLRFPAKQRSEFDLITERFGLKSAWYTELVYPYFQLPGPRARFSSTGGIPGYYAEGFLYLQNAIDQTLIKSVLNETEEFNEYKNYGISLRRFPYPPYIEDKFVFAMQGFLPILVMLSLIYPILNTTRSIVLEKEKKLKESMKMMGLPNYLHWIAWIIKSFTFLTVAILLMTCFISIPFTSQAVMEFTNPFVMFLLVFSFAIQACSIAFFVSTLTNTANIGAIASAVVWFIFFVPYAFLQPRYFFLSRQSKIQGSLFTNAPIALACFILCIKESRGVGLQWADMFSGIGPGDDFCVADCLMLIAVNSTFYFVLAFYIECVWPGEYGVPLPWYFPFTKWYWTGTRQAKKVPISRNSSTPRHMLEAEPKGYAGVKINGLSKKFGKKAAVKDLHLNMYEGQITALLGHNGAGKTTTMSMLTGLYPPTSGTALINNFDIGSEIDSVRTSLGICPQHDVLFDDLTVAEHIRFFCLLKGFPEELVPHETSRLLKVLGLADKANAQAHTLSGGMRRKLSVSIAFCAGSKVVLLDEPTSGMDPSARRSCWDLIQSEKNGRTVLLSTHFMEEADLLGDRIAIMADGELQCAGSSLFLKKKYGGGYHLTIVKDDECNIDNITGLLKKRIPDVVVESNCGAELTYNLPDAKSNLFPEMFEELENRKTELGIASYGTSITTMEEVFVRVGREAERKVADTFDRLNRAHGLAPDTPTSPSPSPVPPPQVGISMNSLLDSNSKTNLHEQTRRNTGRKLLMQQFRAMIVKKLLYILRNRYLLLGQMIVPVLYITIVLAIFSNLPALGNAPPQLISLETYEKYGGVVSSVHCENPSPVCEAFKDTTLSSDYTLKEAANNQSLFDFIVAQQIVDLTLVNYRYIVGYEEKTSNDSSFVDITGFFNNEPLHTPPLIYNLISNSILKSLDKNMSIKVTNYPMPYTQLESGLLAGQIYTLGFQVGYNLCFGVSFLAAGFVVFLIAERESRSKHLQKIAGVKLFIFWMANYIVDFICYLIPCVAILGVLQLFRVDEYSSPQMTANMFTLFAVFGAAIIPWMYLWSFAFHEPSNGFIRVAILNVFCGMIPMIVHAILSIAEFNLGTISNIVNDVFMIFPTYAFGNGMVQMAKNIILREQCGFIFDSEESLEYACILAENFCCTTIKENFFDWEVNGIGKNLAALAILGFLSFLILIGCELRLWDVFKRASSQTHTSSGKGADELIVEDQDVADERLRIRKTPLKKLHETDNIVLRDLTKCYNKFLAVDKLNLGIQRGQTFGLLGVNGAGKTTTFKMLTGDYDCTSGDAFIFSHSIRKDIKGVHQHLGYCPQFDGLITELTGRETLRMFARLRGIWEEDIDAMIHRIASDLIFTEHLDKLVKNYSGGNKRKLSTAMALVGNPPIVMLDEPSTGMDPVARRHLWNAVTKVRESGTSIVLTSHSLEECEILCTRLAIMVNGVFRCLGSPQHLKSKFAEGYTIIAQCPPVGVGPEYTQQHQVSGLRRSSSRNLRKTQMAQKWEQALDGLRLFIEESFPDATLKDIHPGFIHYHIKPSEGITWGKLFGKMEIAKEKFNLDAYSVGQTSLEQVFLNFARSQVEVEEYVKKPGLLDLLMNGIP